MNTESLVLFENIFSDTERVKDIVQNFLNPITMYGVGVFYKYNVNSAHNLVKLFIEPEIIQFNDVIEKMEHDIKREEGEKEKEEEEKEEEEDDERIDFI